jgi:hypothetical protein
MLTHQSDSCWSFDILQRVGARVSCVAIASLGNSAPGQSLFRLC